MHGPTCSELTVLVLISSQLADLENAHSMMVIDFKNAQKRIDMNDDEVVALKEEVQL